MIKIHVMWRGMWRNVYTVDAWTLGAHVCFVLAAVVVVRVLVG